MRKKFVLLFCTLIAVCMCASLFAACGDEERVHVHRLFDFEAKEATCISEGNIAYQECLYCRKKVVNGVEVADDDIVVPIDENNHKALTDIPEQPAKCFETGVIAHKECMDCHKLYKDGEQISETDIVTAAKGSHNFGSALTCSDCDAYKVLYNGNYYVIDVNNYQSIATNPKGATHSSGDNRTEALQAALTNRMTFATQNGSGNSVSNKNGKEWVISSASSAVRSFTRFGYGEGDTAYIGKFLMTFDVTVAKGAPLERMGVKVVDSIKADVCVGFQQAKLIGTNTAEENNPDRKLDVGVKYRFVYEVEITAPDQLVQIFTVFGTGAETVSISNMHFVNVEGKTGRLGSTLVYFGEAADTVIAKEECKHAWQYSVTAANASCVQEGVLAHEYCPQCGSRTVDGQPATDLFLEMTDHDYGELQAAEESTCEVKGHDAYYLCSVCGTYFDENKARLEGLPERELKKHKGEWQSDAEKHWIHCEMCDKDVNEANHIPGPEATETTPQTCTECGRILVPVVGHVHTPSALVPAKEANCTEDGNPAYYRCTDANCGKYFSDEACTQEITEILYTKLGHAMETGVAAKAASCTEDGNLAYHHCTRCDKYFAEAEAVTDITETYFLPKLGHDMTAVAAKDATCHSVKVKTAYHYCSNCDKMFSDESGSAEVTAADVFDYTEAIPAHDFGGGNTCVNEGCGAVREASTITACGPNAFGIQGAVINPELVANPGTWACQGTGSTASDSTANIEDGVLKISAGSHNSKVRSSFVRTIPAKDGKAFVGTYMLSFDFKVTAATGDTATLTVGFFIQSTAQSGNLGTIADVATDFTVGKTYRFTVFVETTDEFQFVQMNIRNAANSGAKSIEVSNAEFALCSEASNTHSVQLASIGFAVPEADAEPTVVSVSQQAILPQNKYGYAA